MAMTDRAAVIVLLERLGAADDAEALQAARELNAIVSASGSRWDDLLCAESLWPGAGIETDDEPSSEAADGTLSEASKTEARRLIERLLARRELSDTLRDDLVDLKAALGDGRFEAMDLRYVRALARRLGA
jgi:hypothetical protein